jgi:phosphomannomutase
MVDEIAARHGGRVERTPVGEAHVAHRMRAVGAAIGGEGNGGVIQPLVHLARDGPAAAALVLECLAARATTLETLVAGLPAFAMVKREYGVEGFEPDAVRRRLEMRFGRGAADTSDGMKISWDTRWVHIRRSGTEPIVRIIAESPTQEETEALVREAAAAFAGGAAQPAGHGR